MPRILGHAIPSLGQVMLAADRLLQLLQQGGARAHRQGATGHHSAPVSARQHGSAPALAAPGQAEALRHDNRTASQSPAVDSKAQREVIVLAALDQAGITDLNERAMFMAQMSHESSGFTRLTENLNYKPARLLAIFPKKFTSLADAQLVVGKGQAAIAERIYGNRRGLGNVHPGDGFKFRGRGIVQLTGRTNYRAAGLAIGIDLELRPEMAADLGTAVQAALWFWRSKGIAKPAQAGDVEKVTRIINGGILGLAERSSAFDAWRRKLAALPTGQAPAKWLP